MNYLVSLKMNSKCKNFKKVRDKIGNRQYKKMLCTSYITNHMTKFKAYMIFAFGIFIPRNKRKYIKGIY